MATPFEQAKDFSMGQLAALVHKLGGTNTVERILRGGDLSGEITKLLDGRNTPRIFTCHVDKSDRAFQPFNKGEFTYVESGLKPEHYPLKGTGIVERRFKVINLWERFPEGHDPTTQELFDLVKAEGEDPDFADTKAFLRDNPGEATNEHPLVSLCGSIVHRYGRRYVAYFIARSDERSLNWYWVDFRWRRHCRLLVAC